ncbi:uncharacterized protein LOC123265119 [Cotesia glomerata]|uniref:uncharacterized protein LOC123265119 n=1 Tax=Cotesia glomerata TaxID=32391 RepID=UPI001D0322C0|nr:uncharacterized protein LOC123265119 [Cotesia glomerata]
MEVDEENSDELVDNSTITPSQDSNTTSSQGTLTTSQSTISHVSNFEDELSLPKVTSKMSIMTPELVAALDRGNVSSRNATYIIAATLKIVGYDLNDVNLSYSTIRRAHISLREGIARELKEQLKLDDNYVVHWDGKLLSDIVRSDTVDRLPIVLSSSGEEQLLGVPKINSGTGIEQATAVHSTLDQWGVSRYVKAVCFDTAVTNTGIYHGAGVELEKALGRELIWLPCRHHMFEIILKNVFEVHWPKQTGPNVPIFNRFKGFRNKIDKSKFKAGIEDTAVDQALSDITDEILGFIGEYLQKYHPRSDYREFLELSSVFLGVVPKENFSFKSPGAMSHARWMSKAIYCLKIFIFREEFKLTTYEINSLREICVYHHKLYNSVVYFDFSDFGRTT